MANDEYREPQQADREVGLRARHETRLARAQSVKGVYGDDAEVERSDEWVWLRVGDADSFARIALMPRAAQQLAQALILAAIEIETPGIAREIGSKGGSDD